MLNGADVILLPPKADTPPAPASAALPRKPSVPPTVGLNPGSVGLPYEGERGAYWALLGPDVEFRRTDYDVEATAEQMRATGDPRVEQIVEMMLEPPPRDEAIEHAESLVFSG